MEKNAKSVTKLLDKSFGKHNFSGVRGRVLHGASSKYYKMIFKTANRQNKLNYRVLSERLTKAKADILANIKIHPKDSLYHEDAKILLNCLHKRIRQVAKRIAQNNYQIVIPEEIEIEYFGGIAYFELYTKGNLGGLRISAQVDCLIEIDFETFIIRDLKTYNRDEGDNPNSPESQYHRDFMQTCLYAIIFENERNQRCKAIQLVYFPDKIIYYEFTEDLREQAKKYVKDTAFEGFEGISFQFPSDDLEKFNDDSALPDENSTSLVSFIDDNESLGWINTIKGKPLQLIMGQDNKMEGFLFPNKASKVKVGYCVIVEKEDDGVRIMCVVKKIECSEDCFPGETSSHKEENYKITLIPVGQFTPEEYQELLPQTIIGGKVKIPRNYEFCEYKKIPQNGLPIGDIQGLNAGVPYPIDIKTLYQSVFMSGQQGTGKTTAAKLLVTKLALADNSPAQIVLDNENEYVALRKSVPSDQFQLMNIELNKGCCLTLKAIDPVDLPNFLHELTAISHDTLQTVIYDIVQDNNGKEFALQELIREISTYMKKDIYGATEGTQKAIFRALNSIALRIFDVPGVKPVDFESMLDSGNVTVINTYNLCDDHQRIVGLYLLAILHKRALKGEQNLNVVFYLDEIQRLIPKSKSQSDADYQKRIIKFLDEVVHRGRKRDYGVIFATQSVADVKKEIIDLCNTKIFFQTQGSGISYIKEYFSNKEDLERLKSLPVGQAFITSKGKHKPVEIKFPNLK